MLTSFRRDYVRITKTYTLAAAQAFQTLPAGDSPFHFVLVSGYGSTFTPGALTPLFGRVKGETELALAAMRQARPAFRASTVRPCAIDWTRHDATKPFIPPQGLTGGALGTLLYGGIRATYRSLSSPTDALGRFLTEMAMGHYEDGVEGKGATVLDGGFKVVENVGFRRLAGLDK